LQYETVNTAFMEKQKTRKVRGSAIITADDEVFFTPYRKLEDSEKPQRTIAACKIGSLSETKNCYLIRLTFAKSTSRQYLIEEFIKLITKL
jgi:hypothetical protein